MTLTDSSCGLESGQKSDIKLLRPTLMSADPLILNLIRKEIYDTLKTIKCPYFSADAFNYLMSNKIKWTKRGYQTPIINALLLSRIRKQFGGRLESIIISGESIDLNTQQLLKASLDINIIKRI